MKKSACSFPVGVEKVLFAAATDEDFRDDLHRDRLEAARQRGLQLTDSEMELLCAIPAVHLDAVLDRMDTSAPNLRRRTLLGAVATTAATVAVADVLTGCATGTGPDEPPDRGAGDGPREAQAGQDQTAPPDQAPPDQK